MKTDIKFTSNLSIDGEEFADIEVSGEYEPGFNDFFITSIKIVDHYDGKKKSIGSVLFSKIILNDSIYEDFTNEAKDKYNQTVGVNDYE